MTNPFTKEQKLFSICTPVFKDAYKQLPHFLSTLNEQEYKEFEVIVVFDGKHTKGEKLLTKEMKKYPDMKVEYCVISHGGAPKARNTALDKSNGDYITFLDPDVYLYPGTLRRWANAFEENPKINRVWGMYDVMDAEGNIKFAIGAIPVMPDGKVYYEAFKYQNYCSGAFPIRKEVCPRWGEEIKSLQDWDLMIQMLKPDFKGEDMMYVNDSFFATAYPHDKGISADSHRNWIDRSQYVRNKNDIPINDICVASHGAPWHGINIAKTLGADYLPMPSFKEHEYKTVYLLGFFTQEDPNNSGIVTQAHMQTFERNKGANIIHWIGSDIMQLRWNNSFEKLKALRNWFKKNNIVHLCEAEFTRKELSEIGIKAKVVPLPPQKLYDPMELPEEFSVAIYNNKSAVYQQELMESVVRSMPDVHFYFFGNEETKGEKGDNFEHLGFVDMDEWLPKWSCNLRVTLHDGLPLTPLQFLTAGRNVVTNVPIKGSIQANTRTEIVKGIREAQKTNLDGKIGKYWKKQLEFKKFIKSIRGYK